MRLLIDVDGEKHWCAGNIVKALKELLEIAKNKSSVRLLTIFYDNIKEKRRFKRELRKAKGDLLQAARNYLNWYNI